MRKLVLLRKVAVGNLPNQARERKQLDAKGCLPISTDQMDEQKGTQST